MKKYVAEFIGTFLLTTVIAGAVMMDALSRSSTANVPFVVFLVLMVLVYTIGPISGAHVNPAVTIGVFTLGKIPGRDAILYIVAQLLGAIVAAIVLLAILGHVASLGATVPVPGWGGVRGAALEALLTFGLVFAVSMTFHPKFPPLASGLAVGGALGLGAFWGGALTGGSMNPARTLGPALISGQFTSVWIYIVGPIVGAIVAALVVRYLLLEGQTEPSPGAKRTRR